MSPPPRFVFRVDGLPISQGSMRALAPGVVTHDKGKALKGWREGIGWHARSIRGTRQPITGAVRLEVTFYLPRFKGLEQKRRAWPDTKPDLDKLVRAIGDALEGVLYTQDSRICELVARKVWADGEAEPAGAEISVLALPMGGECA